MMQLRLFKYLTLINLIVWIGLAIYFLFLIIETTGIVSFFDFFIDIEAIYISLIPIINIFIYIQLYRFNNTVRKLFLPLLIIINLSLFLFEPELVVQKNISEYYWDIFGDLIDYASFFIEGMIFTLMYFTDVKKEFK